LDKGIVGPEQIYGGFGGVWKLCGNVVYYMNI